LLDKKDGTNKNTASLLLSALSPCQGQHGPTGARRSCTDPQSGVCCCHRPTSDADVHSNQVHLRRSVPSTKFARDTEPQQYFRCTGHVRFRVRHTCKPTTNSNERGRVMPWWCWCWCCLLDVVGLLVLVRIGGGHLRPYAVEVSPHQLTRTHAKHSTQKAK
jgi:hypothetical protein